MHKKCLITHSKAPLPIPTEVKFDLFWVLKRRLFSTLFLDFIGTCKKKGGESGALGTSDDLGVYWPSLQ